MIPLLLLALLPIVAVAQTGFGPLRLDDTLSDTYYYPSIAAADENTVRCLWATQTEDTIFAKGRIVNSEGSFVGGTTRYDSASGLTYCPPLVTLHPLESGGEARLFYYS